MNIKINKLKLGDVVQLQEKEGCNIDLPEQAFAVMVIGIEKQGRTITKLNALPVLSHAEGTRINKNGLNFPLTAYQTKKMGLSEQSINVLNYSQISVAPESIKPQMPKLGSCAGSDFLQKVLDYSEKLKVNQLEKAPSKKIQFGDIIAFEDTFPFNGNEKTTSKIGLVTGFKMHKDQKTLLAFEVLPVFSYKANQIVQSSEDWISVQSVEAKLQMGLFDEDKNLLISYMSQLVPDTGSYLNGDEGQSKVRRYGTLHDTALFERIQAHLLRREEQESRFGAVNRGRNKSTTAIVSEGYMVEAGVNVKQAQWRQGGYDAIELRTRVVKPRGFKRDKVHQDISITDAAKIGLLRDQDAKILSAEFDKRRSHPVRTLQEAFKLADEKPRSFKSLVKFSLHDISQPLEDAVQDLNDRVRSACLEFDADMQSESADVTKKYEAVQTKYRADYTPVL